MTTVKLLLKGFPGRTLRGWLGWSTVVLVQSDGQNLLFDTGSQADRPSMLENFGMIGLEPPQINTVVLSHLHFDHAANVELFTNAEIVVHETTVAYARQQVGQDLALSGWLTAGVLESPKLRVIEDEPEIWPGLQIIQTPGHTGGCISLKLAHNNETWVLAADAVKHRQELEAGVAETGFDLLASQKSIARIRRLANCIVPGHDVPLRVTDQGVEIKETAHFEVSSTLQNSETKTATLVL